ncbi:hypothetical protein ACHAXT_008495 [Thalassiosira profunda]
MVPAPPMDAVLLSFQRFGLQERPPRPPVGTFDDVVRTHYVNKSFHYVPRKAVDRVLNPAAKAKFHINEELITRQLHNTHPTRAAIQTILKKYWKKVDEKAVEWEEMVKDCPHGDECYKIRGDGDNGTKGPMSDVTYMKMAMEAAAANTNRGKHPVTFLGFCGIGKYRGYHTLANGGYCLEDYDFNGSNSTEGALNWADTLTKMGIIFPVSRNHHFQQVAFNSRLCPNTKEEADKFKDKQQEKQKKQKKTGKKSYKPHLPCPPFTEAEAVLRADQIDLLHEFYVEIGQMPIFINIAGRSASNKTQMVYNRLEKANIALGIWHLYHMQFSGSPSDKPMAHQIAHVSFILDEFRDRVKRTSLLSRVKSIVFHKKSFEEIFLPKLESSARAAGVAHYEYVNECNQVRNDLQWMKRYNELLRFVKLNKHCNVPAEKACGTEGWSKELGQWVHTQRKLKKGGTLREDREKLLKQAGFVSVIIGGAVRVRTVVNGSPSETDYTDFASLRDARKSKNGCGESLPKVKGERWGKAITRDMVRGAPNGVLIIDRSKNRQTRNVSQLQRGKISLRQEAAQRSAEDAARLREERANETRATEALRVWEAEARDKDRKERQQLEKQRNEQLLDWKRAQEETQHRLEAERLAREEEFQRMQREAAKRDAERLAQDAETLRLHQEAAEKAEAAAEEMKSTVKQLRLERALAKEEREQVTSRLRFEEMGTGTGPKTATTGASTTTGSTAPPPSIAFQKENANPNRKSIHVQQLEQQVRALEGGKRKDEEEKKRLQKKFEMEAKEKERLLRQQRGKTRSERIESKKPEETAQGRRATEAAAFDKAKKQEGWRRSTRLRDSNPVKHGKPTYR